MDKHINAVDLSLSKEEAKVLVAAIHDAVLSGYFEPEDVDILRGIGRRISS